MIKSKQIEYLLKSDSYVSAAYNKSCIDKSGKRNPHIKIWQRDEDDNLCHVELDPKWYYYTKVSSQNIDEDVQLYKDMFGENLQKIECTSENKLKNQIIKYYIHSEYDTHISKLQYDDIKNSILKNIDDLVKSLGISHEKAVEKYQVEIDNLRKYIPIKHDNIYESDIPPELKVLSDKFYKIPHKKLHISGYDIETDYDDDIGFSRPTANFKPEDYRGDFEKKPDTPYAPINSISIYNFWENKNYLIAIPPNNEDANDIDVDDFMKKIQDIEPLDLPTSLEFVNTEAELLLRFLDIIEDSDLIFGWNSDTFDNPYIAQRIQIVLDTDFDSKSTRSKMKYNHDTHETEEISESYTSGPNFNRLSFDGIEPKYSTVEKFGDQVPVIEIYGRTATDYLELYKKFSFGEKPSYKLESIAEEELPKMRKLEYDGSLYDLYRNDFHKFVRYNIRDTEILYGFESKLGFIELANAMYHNTTGLFKHVFGTLKNTELAMINFCHHELGDIKVQDNYYESTTETIEGAYVLPTVAGQHDWVASIDITSLYPSAIRSNNISPDTIIGQFSNTKEDFELIKMKSDDIITLYIDKKCNILCPEFTKIMDETTSDDLGSISLSAKHWPLFFKKYNWTISGYGTVFDQNKKGLLPTLLESWFIERKKTKKLSFEYAKKAEKLLEKYQ